MNQQLKLHYLKFAFDTKKQWGKEKNFLSNDNLGGKIRTLDLLILANSRAAVYFKALSRWMKWQQTLHLYSILKRVLQQSELKRILFQFLASRLFTKTIEDLFCFTFIIIKSCFWNKQFFPAWKAFKSHQFKFDCKQSKKLGQGGGSVG